MARFSKTFDPSSDEPFRVSRSKIDLFVECPRCAYLDLRLGVKRPEFPSFTLNNAVDELMKKEFDIHRAEQSLHPLLENYKLKLKPLQDERLEEWRDALRRGIAVHHAPTNLYVRGGVDDVWVDGDGKLIVVDYKATAKQSDVTLDADWQIAYKRQMEVYQWLLRQNDFEVSDTGYFVYANGRLDLDGFHNKVEFFTKVIPYTGDDSWVDPTIKKMKKCMENEMPAVGKAAMGGDCDYCAYAKARTDLTLKHVQKNQKAIKSKV